MAIEVSTKLEESRGGKKLKQLKELVKKNEITLPVAKSQARAIAKRDPDLEPIVQRCLDKWRVENDETKKDIAESKLIEVMFEGEDEGNKVRAAGLLLKGRQDKQAAVQGGQVINITAETIGFFKGLDEYETREEIKNEPKSITHTSIHPDKDVNCGHAVTSDLIPEERAINDTEVQQDGNGSSGERDGGCVSKPKGSPSSTKK